ncbi:hypothetical protein [Roseococcus suduntuyensis]|uniref:Uncharacterized protein n=1 Tax=Roseococcus suduntuyensis TaxID=455361 RepID=A0A840A8K0_9PROT|nr:hypothetical protein [Roseococcus suduntuyensis]MBB3896833.1 hypothetical protein [Roseococcus suduntuyensis]
MRRLAFGLLALLGLGAPAAAQDYRAVGPFPHISGELDLGLLTQAQPRAADRTVRGSSSFLFGELAAGLHLSPTLSLQGVLAFDPAGEQLPNGTDIFLRRQAAFLESLFLDWRAHERLRLQAGKFNAPFGYGHHSFPGAFARFRAHEAYLIRESLGVGATYTWLSDTRFGEHDISAALFTLDTSPFSNTLFTRRRCCEEGFERYSRNSLRQGGAGNNGRLTNFAIALDGDRMPFLPNFSYHAAMVSRGAGKDGAAREWGYALGARFRVEWTPRVRTLFFGEFVEFRNAGGRPIEVIDEDGTELAVRERRRFGTLGAQTTHGDWRATLVWQVEERRREANRVPTRRYLEATVGREIGWGFGVDLGYQYAVNPGEERTGSAHGFVSRLGFTQRF